LVVRRDCGNTKATEAHMTPILVFYGSTEGHTAKIARWLADRLRARGRDVEIVRAGRADPDPERYSAVVVAASLHGGRHQRAVARWVRAHAPILARKPTAFVTVCLAILENKLEVRREITSIVDRFCNETRWRPTIANTVAGALPWTKYGWLKRWIMKRIVEKAGGDVDTSRDYEYTDWNDLRSFIDQFDRLVAEGARPSGGVSAPPRPQVA
jgi:menaquinone-dependent protoporphyrinogen oxidase